METENPVYGECAKHRGQSMINCPLCEMENSREKVDYHFNILKNKDIYLPPCDSANGKSAIIDTFKRKTMTKEELNQYLIDIDLKILCLYYKKDAEGKLVLDDQGNPINEYFQATAGMMEIDEGWYQLIHDLIAELIKTDWDKDIHQIKEKFGGLCFYVGGASEVVHDIISKYEDLSYETCEVCGEKGELRKDTGWHGGRWYKTMCDKHYQELKDERK